MKYLYLWQTIHFEIWDEDHQVHNAKSGNEFFKNCSDFEMYSIEDYFSRPLELEKNT